MEAIRDTIKSVIGALAEKKSGKNELNPQGWLKNVLTKRELGHIKINYFRKGILGLKIDSASWLYFFNLRKDALLADLRKQSKEVKELRFNIGDIE
jgi:hypothetical protein